MTKTGAIRINNRTRIIGNSDVTKSPYMDMDCQFISIYGKFVTSLSAFYSCEDIMVVIMN